jgi:disulfide bond formation protein DsbB
MLYPFLKDIQKAAAVIVFVSFVTLVVVLISQYIFGLKPCELCIYQRIPYVFIIAFGLIAYGAAKQDKKVSKFFMALAGITFLIGMSIASFHVGVEQAWWAGLEKCGSNINEAVMTLEELRLKVLGAPVTKCNEIAWSMFGISMAGYNAILSLMMAVFTFMAIKTGVYHD